MSSTKGIWRELRAAGRIVDHPVFPGKQGPAARALETEADVRDVIAMMRMNYDRVVERYGLSEGAASSRASASARSAAQATVG